jgi:hypothetical protein
MGEGWSDWLALVLTASAGDTATTKRGIGTYVLGEPVTGNGIRDFPYSTNLAVDPRTYDTIKDPNTSIPHGVGSTWAAMLWEVYWALVNQYGFSADLYNGNAGNNLAIQLVLDGMKLQNCEPGFVDGRNAIIQADVANNGGANQCLIWQAFAKRGLGFSATQGSSDRVDDGTEAFDLPPTCTLLSAIPASQNICVGSNAVYTVTARPGYVNAVNLSLSGKPAGTSHSFNPTPITPPFPDTSRLTISNTVGATPGNYTLTITGDDGPTSGTFNVGLNVYAGPPAGTITLVSPANNTTDQSTKPTFSWTNSAPAQAANYRLEVAKDAGFTNIVYSVVVTGTSHTPSAPLSANTRYYWRVRAQNFCGSGANSAVFNFTTALALCRTPSTPILDPPNILTDTLVVTTPGQLLDLDVSIDAAHTWVGDLIFTLKHVNSGTSIRLIDRPGRPDINPPSNDFGCSNDNIRATLNDGAAAPVEDQCALPVPTIEGNFSPNQALSAFNGKSLNGTWQLIVTDTSEGDTGTLSEWCLIPQAQNLPPAEPVIVLNTSTLNSSQAPNSITNKSFTIRNAGQETLTWTIQDQAPGLNPSPPVENLAPGQGIAKKLSPIAPPTQKPQPSSAVEILKDGGFEKGRPNPNWAEYSFNDVPLICDIPGCGSGGGTGPRSGSFWAWLGGLNVYEEGSLTQTVTIPAGADTLRFYLEQITCDSTLDYLEILIDGNPVFLTDGSSSLCGQAGYTLQSVDISPFANGYSHKLVFHSETFALGGTPTNFFVDDVSLANEQCVPNNIPWAIVAPASGNNSSGVTKPVQVTFNSTGLTIGTYNATLCIANNDSTNNPLLLPVTLKVQRQLYLPTIRKQN